MREGEGALAARCWLHCWWTIDCESLQTDQAGQGGQVCCSCYNLILQDLHAQLCQVHQLRDLLCAASAKGRQGDAQAAQMAHCWQAQDTTHIVVACLARPPLLLLLCIIRVYA